MTSKIAKQLRKNMTDAERHLWQKLRAKQLFGYKFRRQHPIGHYVVDFVCLEQKLILEIDGSQHFEKACKDADRTKWLNLQGYKVIRFWNNQVLQETDSVLGEILRYLSTPPPQPSP